MQPYLVIAVWGSISGQYCLCPNSERPSGSWNVLSDFVSSFASHTPFPPPLFDADTNLNCWRQQNAPEPPKAPEVPKVEAPEPPKAPEVPKVEAPEPPKAPEVPKVEAPEPPKAPKVPKVEAPEPPKAPEVPKVEAPEPPKAPELPKVEVPEPPKAPELPKVEVPEPPKAPEVPKVEARGKKRGASLYNHPRISTVAEEEINCPQESYIKCGVQNHLFRGYQLCRGVR